MKRILRVIEYTGTDAFLTACIERRFVKGTKEFGTGTIREGVLGDMAEILPEITPVKEMLDNIAEAHARLTQERQ